MASNPKTTKQGPILTAVLLACGASLAIACLSEAANSAPRRSRVYYRIVPDWRNHVPYEVGVSDSGPYHQDILPDGTVTGPIGPDANGG